MKTAVKEEGVNLAKIEKTTDQILKKINSIRSTMFINDFKLSKKAQQEKEFILKTLFPKSLFSVKNALETFARITEHANFSKLEKEDQDFILGLDKKGFKNSVYIKEIHDFISKAKDLEAGFVTVIEETIYFTLLNSELNLIESRLLRIV